MLSRVEASGRLQHNRCRDYDETFHVPPEWRVLTADSPDYLPPENLIAESYLNTLASPTRRVMRW